MHKHANIMSEMSMGVILHGGAHALVYIMMDLDACFLLNDGVNVPLHGGAAAQMLMLVVVTVDGIVNGDAVDQAANMYGGDPTGNNQFKTNSSFLETLNLSLDFFNPQNSVFPLYLLTPSGQLSVMAQVLPSQVHDPLLQCQQPRVGTEQEEQHGCDDDLFTGFIRKENNTSLATYGSWDA